MGPGHRISCHGAGAGHPGRNLVRLAEDQEDIRRGILDVDHLLKTGVSLLSCGNLKLACLWYQMAGNEEHVENRQRSAMLWDGSGVEQWTALSALPLASGLNT
jgi:hypothetical protein